MRNRDPARLPPLDLLAAFEAAARHLSFTQAAVERFVTQSAISRQIRQLEDDLGAPLFERRHRALALTDEGRRLFATCLQHEIDHLNGVLFIDHISRLKRDMVMKKFRKLARDKPAGRMVG